MLGLLLTFVKAIYPFQLSMLNAILVKTSKPYVAIIKSNTQCVSSSLYGIIMPCF